METSKEVLGAEHPNTLTSMENLAITLKARGHDQFALQRISDCATLSSQVLGTSHPYFVDRYGLVEEWRISIIEQNDVSSAIPVVLKARSGMLTVLQQTENEL